MYVLLFFFEVDDDSNMDSGSAFNTSNVHFLLVCPIAILEEKQGRMGLESRKGEIEQIKETRIFLKKVLSTVVNGLIHRCQVNNDSVNKCYVRC